MSRTFNLGCEQCRVSLWIGQARYVETAVSVYTTEPDAKRLGQFFFDHMGHPLKLLDSQDAPDEWEEIDVGDET